jgi:class 3 adenylate cyclase
VGTSAPSGTVTFLFTDIEGSTRLWEASPEAMAEALERHDAIVRSAIDAHGGFVFSTGGDGVAAAFGRAADALSAATVAQAGLAGEVWPEEASIRVRMGIHTGEAIERDGDYFRAGAEPNGPIDGRGPWEPDGVLTGDSGTGGGGRRPPQLGLAPPS